jgi:hypothetical protein
VSKSSIFSSKYFLLGLLIAVHFLFWVLRKPPVPGSDDFVYFQSAKSLVAGDYKLNESPKNHRLMVFGPVAGFIKLFGESPWIISVWPLICSCVTLTALFIFLSKLSSMAHAFSSSLLLATNTLQIDYSDSLFPDVIVAMFALLFLIIVYVGRTSHSKQWLYAIGAALLFFCGFLAKEIIIFLIPFISVIIINDYKNELPFDFWKKLISIMMLIGVIFISFYYYLTGNLNFIYHSIDVRHSQFYELQKPIDIINRLTILPIKMFAENVGYIILILSLVYCFLAFNVKTLIQNNIIKFFHTYFFLLLVIYWIVPISFTHFTLIHLDPRMWMLLLCPLYIIGGYGISKTIVEGNRLAINLWILIFITASIIALIFVSPQRAFMFLTFAISALLFLVLQKKIKNQIVSILIFLSPAIVLALRFTWANSNFFIQNP